MDRQAWANIVDPDQTVSDQGLRYSSLTQQFYTILK